MSPERPKAKKEMRGSGGRSPPWLGKGSAGVDKGGMGWYFVCSFMEWGGVEWGGLRVRMGEARSFIYHCGLTRKFGDRKKKDVSQDKDIEEKYETVFDD